MKYLWLSLLAPIAPWSIEPAAATSIHGCYSDELIQTCTRLAPLHVAGTLQTPQRFAVADFEVEVGGGDPLRSAIVIHHRSQPARPVWQTPPGKSFLAAGTGSSRVVERQGSFIVRDDLALYCNEHSVDAVEHSGDRLVVSGSFAPRCPVGYRMEFVAAGGGKLDFAVTLVPVGAGEIGQFNRLYLVQRSDHEERFFGFGIQFARTDMKGKRLPVLVQEQGIGRGIARLTAALAVVGRRAVAGQWYSTYAPAPQYVSSRMYSLFLKNEEYSVFDLTDPLSVQIEVAAPRLHGQLIAAAAPLELIERYTEYAGRMPPSPDWLHEGAIVGIQGGTERVREAAQRLRAVGAPVTAFWLQDWVGQRRTGIATQLWWNWELDRSHYPGWDQLREELAAERVRILSYINPFLVDVARKPWYERNLFREAAALGLLVSHADGTPRSFPVTTFSAGLLDLSRPATRAWVKTLIREEMLGRTGASGWMADFGEALPVEGGAGEVAAAHNAYATEWARLNLEAVQESGRAGEVLFFSRSGFTRSPGHAPLFWLGDQTVTWDDRDGIKTVVTGMLNGGFSGFAITHSDIGGYTAVDQPGLRYHRSAELLLRWAELNAFTPVFRTHEGNLPQVNHQFDSDRDTLVRFGRYARMYRALGDYRRRLFQEAWERGWPVVRHMFLHYPQDVEAAALDRQFLLGRDLLVAPVLDPGRTQVRVYVPEPGWRHVWSDAEVPPGWQLVDAPLGQPAVFYRAASRGAASAARALRAAARD